MTTVKAADLPEGSVVATRWRVYLRAYDPALTDDFPWIYAERGSMYVNQADDDELQEALDAGAAVLREGM